MHRCLESKFLTFKNPELLLVFFALNNVTVDDLSKILKFMVSRDQGDSFIEFVHYIINEHEENETEVEIEIKRPPKYGGDKVYHTFISINLDLKSGILCMPDLALGIATHVWRIMNFLCANLKLKESVAIRESFNMGCIYASLCPLVEKEDAKTVKNFLEINKIQTLNKFATESLLSIASKRENEAEFVEIIEGIGKP
jgi:hypothetical protein